MKPIGFLLLGLLAVAAAADDSQPNIFTYKLPAASEMEAASKPAVAMPAYHVESAPDRLFWDFQEALARSDLLAPCVLFTREFHSFQLQALSAPLFPMAEESRGMELHVRIGLLTVAW